jgi:hypothetical protein
MKMETNGSRQTKKQTFECKVCDYKCSKLFLWSQHIKTKKHQKLNKYAEETNIKNDTKYHVCNNCGMQYMTRSGLWKHKKHGSCIEIPPPSIHVEKNSSNDISKVTDMLLTVMKDNEKLHNLLFEQQKQMGEMIPQMGNNNNNKFNLNVFLNEQCKDAINIQDFINSLTVQLKDLEYAKTNGITKGITQVLMNGLKELDVYNRPIHCTDTKRTTMYVKDQNEWEKDKENEKIKESIASLNKKHIFAIKEWEKAHPDWEKSNKMTDEYMKMVQAITQQDSQAENLIIKTVAKEVIVEKKE